MVSDPAGASVPAAKVTLSSSDTGFIRSFVTQESGQFVFPLLPPGQYQLRIERVGFKLYVHSSILLGAGQASKLNPMLEISADPQVMVVEDAARMLDTASGMNIRLRGESLHDMPMEGRNFLNLAGAAPGVAGMGSLSDFDNFAPEKDFDFSANGRGSTGNIFLLDGLNVTSNIVSGVGQPLAESGLHPGVQRPDQHLYRGAGPGKLVAGLHGDARWHQHLARYGQLLFL